MTQRLSAQQVQDKLDASPFIHWMSLKVEQIDYEREEITIKVPMRPEFERIRDSGQWHGGPLAAIIDTVGDFALGMLIGRGLPTINFSVDYLRPAINTDLTAVARVRRNGRSVGVADVDLYNAQGTLLAIGRATYSTLIKGS